MSICLMSVSEYFIRVETSELETPSTSHGEGDLVGSGHGMQTQENPQNRVAV